MLFILGFIIGSLIALVLTYGVLYLYFHYQQPINTRISQLIAQSKPKGDFIQAPTEGEIVRKEKFNKLSKIKTEIRLADILDK